MSASHPMHRTGPGLTTRSIDDNLHSLRVDRLAAVNLRLPGHGRVVLLIPGTASAAHLRENLAAEYVSLDDKALRELAGVAV
jgi:aryl-alcohol dehydrogenase-like predicted oxidoreductase